MKFSLVKPNGNISHSHEFAFTPAQPIPAKGRWLPDVLPDFNPATHVAQVVEPVPDNATAISYTVVSRPRGQVRAEKKAELQAARDAALVADVTVGARTWPTDEKFTRKLNTLISRAGRGKSALAKLRGSAGPALNTPTLNQLEAIEDAIFAAEAAAWDRYWELLDIIEAPAATVDSIFTVTW